MHFYLSDICICKPKCKSLSKVDSSKSSLSPLSPMYDDDVYLSDNDDDVYLDK
jgi:hypothetical protein